MLLQPDCAQVADSGASWHVSAKKAVLLSDALCAQVAAEVLSELEVPYTTELDF